MEFSNTIADPWFWAFIIGVAVLFYFGHRKGFEAGVIAGVERTLDELVKEGLLYMDEREELKRRKP